MKELIEILKEVRPECDFTGSKDFIYEGLLDSFDVVTIVSKLEEKMRITIDGEDVTPENFKNLETLEKFLKKYVENYGTEIL